MCFKFNFFVLAELVRSECLIGSRFSVAFSLIDCGNHIVIRKIHKKIKFKIASHFDSKDYASELSFKPFPKDLNEIHKKRIKQNSLCLKVPFAQ